MKKTWKIVNPVWLGKEKKPTFVEHPEYKGLSWKEKIEKFERLTGIKLLKKTAIMIAAMVLFATSAFGLTATSVYYKRGDFVDQYTFVGGTYDGEILYEMHRVCTVVTQVSSSDYHTNTELLGIYCDGEDPYDPFAAENKADNPLLNEREEAKAAGIQIVDPTGSKLTPAEEKLIYVAFWYELYVFPALKAAYNDKISVSGWNPNQEKIAVASVLYAETVPKATADSIAVAFVDSGTKPTYFDFGLSTPSNYMNSFMKELSSVGYFE